MILSEWSAYCLFGRDLSPGKSEIIPGVLKAQFLIEFSTVADYSKALAPPTTSRIS